jgi:hypothetical protein
MRFTRESADIITQKQKVRFCSSSTRTANKTELHQLSGGGHRGLTAYVNADFLRTRSVQHATR